VLLVAAAAILGGVVLAALGRAGEMATFAGDTAPIELDEVSATDVALLRPPMSLWGYNAQATEDALRVIARSVTARDVEIATLRRELADLQARQDGARAAGVGDRPTAPAGPTAPASPESPVSPASPGSPVSPASPGSPGSPASPGGPVRQGGSAGGTSPGSRASPASGASPTRAAGPAGPPAGQSRRADPPADEEYRADPPWLPSWQRPSGPETDGEAGAGAGAQGRGWDR
jgi:hypothetical protein